MPWSKLKNIILIILTVTNLCLLALVAIPTLQSGRLLSQAREDAILLLQNSGVQVEADAVPQSMELPAQVAKRDLEWEERAAAALLGGPVTAQARGGEVYSYYNDRGSIQFHSDGTCSSQLEPGAVPLGEDRAAGCLALLKKMGLEGEILEDEGEALLFRQTWKGWPLFTQQITVLCQEDFLSAITAGRLMAAAPQPDPARQTVTVATALIDLFNGVTALGDVCNRIDAVEPGYITAAALTGATVLTPVWRVTTDTGVYQLDAVSGEVSRVS